MALTAFIDPKTGTPTDDEIAFQSWYRSHAERLGMPANPDTLVTQYDFRHAFLEGYEPDDDGTWDHRASTAFARTAGTKRVDRTRPRFGSTGIAPYAPGAAESVPPLVSPGIAETTTPVPLTATARAEIEQRLAAIQARITTYNEAVGAYAKGYISPDDATNYRILSKSTDEYARRMARHGRTFVKGLTDGEAAIANYYQSGFMPAVSQFMMRGLAHAGLGAMSLLGKGGALLSGQPVNTGEPDVAALREKIETEFFGLPRDPIERAGYDHAFPWLGREIGDLAAWIATTASPGQAARAYTRATGSAVDLATQIGVSGTLPRWMSAARGARGIVPITAIGAAGGAITGAALAPDDERGRGAFEGFFVGLGGTALTSTLLAGRPIGTPARLLKLQTMIETLGAEGVGGALRVAPRLSFGRLAGSALEGGAYVTLKQMGQGTPVNEAVGHGVEEALTFAGFDTALLGLGRAARWLPIHARIADTWVKTAEALKIPSRMAAQVPDAANAVVQALPGIAAGGVLGPIAAAIGGTISAKKALELQKELVITAARLRSTGMLKPETINKILTGNYTKMSADEAEAVTRALTKDVIERATADADPILRYAVRESVGSESSLALDSDELKALVYERGRVTQAIAQMRDQGILEIDPQMIQASKRLMEIAERRSQILLEHTNRYPDGLLKSTHSGVMGRVSEVEARAQIREIIESAANNEGFFVVARNVARETKSGLGTRTRKIPPAIGVIPRSDTGAQSALNRLHASIKAASGTAATTGAPTRVLFRSNSTLLRDYADAGFERAGIDAAISPEGARALDRILAHPSKLSPRAVEMLLPPERKLLESPAILAENVGRAPGPSPQITGNLQRALPGRAVGPAGVKGEKRPFIDFDFGDSSGRIGSGLATRLGGTALGGAIGAAADDESPLRGAAIGAAVGLGGASLGERLLARASTRTTAATAARTAQAVERRAVPRKSVPLSAMTTRERAIETAYANARRSRTTLDPDLVKTIDALKQSGATSAEIERTIEAAGGRPVDYGPLYERRTLGDETGAIARGPLTTAAAGAIGAVVAPAIARRIGLLDEEDSILTASAIGFLTGAGLGYRTLGRNGIRLTADASQVARFVKPTLTESLPAADIARLVGKSGDAFKTTVNGSQVSGRRLYWMLPHTQQIEHTVRNIETWPSRTVDARGKPLEMADRRAAFETDLKRFAPFSITDADWSRITRSFESSTAALGYTKADAMRLYKGWLGWMTTPLESRARTDISRMSLDRLGRDANNPFTTAAGIDELRTRAVTADVLTGPAMPLPRNYRRASNTLNKDGTPAASRIRALVDDIEGNRPSSAEGVADTVVPMWPAGIAPTVRFYRYADRLIASGDRAVGEEIQRVASGIFQATSFARVADDTDRALLAGIFKSIGTPADMALLRTAVENKATRDSLAGTNPRIYEAALGIRKFLRDKADELGLPEFERIEDYLPWVYNYRTKRELKELAERGVTPNDVNYPADAPVPRHVFFNHLESRTADAPLGTLMSPYESLLMYSHGANRKIYIDQLLANFTPETFARIRAKQPWISHDLGRWLLDVVGVPGPGTMKIQKQVEQVGLFLEKFPMFQRPGLAQEINDKYFLSPGGANSLSRVATGWAYTSKIAWNMLSAMTNLSQQIINGSTEYGLINVLSSSVIGANVAVGERIPVLAPILDAVTPRTAEYRRLLVERGILSETAQRHFDNIAIYEAKFGTNRAHLAVTGIPVGAAAGALTTALLNTDRDNSDQLSIAGGALTGATVATIGAAKSSIMRRALLRVRDAGTFTFNLAETWNRAAIGIAGIREAKATERALASPAYAARRRAGEIVDGIFTGALGGAATANVAGGDILTGAALGAGAAAAGAPFGESRTARTARSLETIKATGGIFENRIIRDQAKDALRPFTIDEVNGLYAQMQTDITQFRIAKEGRGYFLNTPHGQALGALQSYTLNQAEFVGGRLQSFIETASKAVSGQPQAVDFRVFRFASFLMAVGSVYGAILGGANDGESDPDYWVSRLGFGVMPLLLWDDATNKWEVKSPTDLFKGPIISDIWNTGNSYLKLIQDDRASASFIDTSDRIVTQLFPGARAIVNSSKQRDGAATIKLFEEGAAEAIGTARPPGR